MALFCSGSSLFLSTDAFSSACLSSAARLSALDLFNISFTDYSFETSQLHSQVCQLLHADL